MTVALWLRHPDWPRCTLWYSRGWISAPFIWQCPTAWSEPWLRKNRHLWWILALYPAYLAVILVKGNRVQARASPCVIMCDCLSTSLLWLASCFLLGKTFDPLTYWNHRGENFARRPGRENNSPQWDVFPHFLSHTFSHVRNGSQLRILPRSLILQSVMVRRHRWAPGVQTHRTYGSMGLWLMAIHLFKARKREFEPQSLNLNQNHSPWRFFPFALRARSSSQR